MTGPITFLHTRQIRRSGVRRQADREGGQHHDRRLRGERRGAGPRGRRHAGLRPQGEQLRRARALRPVCGVVHRHALHAPGVHGQPQHARRHRREFPTGADAVGRVQGHAVRPPSTWMGLNRQGQLFDASWRLNSRHWSASIFAYALSPDFRHDLGFVRRVDQQRIFSRLSYTFWPESTIVNWGPSLIYAWNQNYDGVLEGRRSPRRLPGHVRAEHQPQRGCPGRDGAGSGGSTSRSV